MYGLRLLMNVNQSDYLPTTEAAGIRLLVHDQTQQPFPDTFGYSAPTGTISSFGLKSKALERLGEPYGSCIKDGRTKDYIYSEEYSVEVKIFCIKLFCFRDNLMASSQKWT